MSTCVATTAQGSVSHPLRSAINYERSKYQCNGRRFEHLRACQVSLTHALRPVQGVGNVTLVAFTLPTFFLNFYSRKSTLRMRRPLFREPGPKGEGEGEANEDVGFWKN